MIFDTDLRLSSGKRLTAWIGVAALLLTALGALVMLVTLSKRLEDSIAQDRSALMGTAASVVEQSLARAITHNLPPSQLPGITNYLEDLLIRLPEVYHISLHIDGYVFSVGQDITGSIHTTHSLSLPPHEAKLEISYSNAPLSNHWMTIFGVILIASLVSAIAASTFFWFFWGRDYARDNKALKQRLNGLSLGDFRVSPQLPDVLPPALALNAIHDAVAPLHLRHSLLRQHAQALRAIDYDGSLSAQVAQVLGQLPSSWQFSSSPSPKSDPAYSKAGL